MKEKQMNQPPTIEDALRQYEGMVKHFVDSAAKNYVCGEEDLMQEGRMAIINAYNTYNPQKGAAFSTWVYKKVRGSILDYQKKNLYSISGGTYLRQAIRDLGDDVSVDKLMQLGISRKTAVLYESVSQMVYLQVEDLYDLEDTSFNFEHYEMLWDIKNWRKYLTEKQIAAFELHFGFNSRGEGITILETAKMLDSSYRGTIKLIKAGITKLREMLEVQI